MADEIEPQETTHGMDRRTLIKRAAIIGGVAWVTPLIATTPAFAAGAGSTVTYRCCACDLCNPIFKSCDLDTTTTYQTASLFNCQNYCLNVKGCASWDYLECSSGFPNPCITGTSRSGSSGVRVCVCP